MRWASHYICSAMLNTCANVPAPAPEIEAPAPLDNWQTILGLSPQKPTVQRTQPPQPVRVPSPPPGLNGFGFDDDLGFDPFSESSKGLAMLVEEEKERQQQRQSVQRWVYSGCTHSSLQFFSDRPISIHS